MKRGIAGRGRRGSPPLPRQRTALRVVQLTLLAVSVVLAVFAARALEGRATAAPNASSRISEVVALAGVAAMFLAVAVWMGLRTVRGPEPPSLD